MAENTHEKLIVLSGKKFADRVKKLFASTQIKMELGFSINQIPKLYEKNQYDVFLLNTEDFPEDKKTFLNLIEDVLKKVPGIRIIVLIPKERISLAVSTILAGAYHYAKLPIADKELKLLIETALQDEPEESQVTAAKTPSGSRFGQIIGQSQVMKRVYQQIKQAAITDIPILLIGETGAGKDLVAQTIHRESARKQNIYIAVNLGALPSELVGSELFGHEKGSFTGASSQHKGVFERADKGTIFLDEIDAMDEKVQVSLLRVIENKKFNRLGGKKSIRTDMRLIAASNANLDELVAQGTFRDDLFYRLDVFRIQIPPLRERREDIPLIVQDLLEKYNQSFSKNIREISDDAMQLLQDFDWPGNVRELKNVIQRAVLICNDDTINSRHLPIRFRNIRQSRETITFKLGTPLLDVEKELVIRALEACENNRTEAAKLLGISRRAIYNKLKKFELD